MKRINRYAALFAVLAGLLVMGCDNGNGSGGGNEPVSPLTVTNGTVISCDRTTKGTVKIPSSVTAIADYAFSGCTGLTEVTIPSGIRSVGQNAFAGCRNLTIRYAGTKAQWERLGVDTKDVTVVCRDGTVGEGDGGQGEEPVTYYTVTFYPNVPQNAGSAGLSPVTRTYVDGSTSQIPDGLFVLDGYRLVGWATNAGDSTVSCYTGDNFAVHDDRSFYAVWEAIVDIPVNGVIIKDNIVVEYRPDSGVTEVTIPGGVTAIGDSAFRGCAGVTSVAIPYGVTSIGSSAFEGCIGLASVEIPASVTSIGNGAFSGCSSLTIHYNGTRAQWESLRIETYGVPVVCADDGQGSENQPDVLTIQNRVVVKCDPSATGYIEIQPGVTEIAANAFSNCVSIKGVVIPDGVTSIGNGAFRYCSDMLSVEVPGSVTYIGDRAFEYCNRLEEVNFTGTVSQLAALGLDTKGVKDMGTVSVTVNYGKPGQGLCHFVDSGDETLTGYVIIPSGVTEIKGRLGSDLGAFEYCVGIKGVMISSSVTSIGENAFYGCTGLTYVEVPGSVKKFGSAGFGSNNYSNLVEINYTGTFAEWASWGGILSYNFSDEDIILTIDGRLASEITAITADDLAGVTSICNYAFYKWSNLESVTIPNSVTYIGYNVFTGCDNLAKIDYAGTIAQYVSCDSDIRYYNKLVIDGRLASEITAITADDLAGVTSICDYAFYNWSNLKSVTIPAGVTNIGWSAFEGCTSLTDVKIPDSVTSIASYAFSGCSSLTSVTIPDGVTSIASYAFSGCTGLTNVTIPKGVTSINSYAFFGCSSLTTIWYDGTETEWNKISRWSNSNDGLSGKTITGNDGTTWTAK